jgi:hypothetical protein
VLFQIAGSEWHGRFPKTRQNGILGKVKWTVWRLFLPVAAIALIGWAGSSSVGATTSQSRQICAAWKPAVQSGQKMLPIVAGTNTQTFSESKTELLSAANAVLNTSTSVKAELRSAPANVKASFNRVLAADSRFRAAVKTAKTPAQIKLAVRDLISRPSGGAGPFLAYVVCRCEGSDSVP